MSYRLLYRDPNGVRFSVESVEGTDSRDRSKNPCFARPGLKVFSLEPHPLAALKVGAGSFVQR
jgi:hypothetical protein